MNPKLPKYLIDIIDCDDSDFFLTEDVNKLDLEIYNNCVYVSLDSKERESISSIDLEKFISKVKDDRRKKLINSNLEVDLIYYVWFDEMAGQLRFNFINSNHTKLPFGAKLIVVDSEKEIIAEYLNAEIIDISQFEGVSEIIDGNEQNDEIFTLKVYTELITRN
jgi:hypothetical protein